MKIDSTLGLGIGTLVVYAGLFGALSFVQPDLGGLTYFDLSIIGYDFPRAREIIGSFSTRSLNIYYWAIFPLDILFPLFYCLLAYRGLRKFVPSIPLRKGAWVLPSLVFLADIAENTAILFLFRGGMSELGVKIASTLTQVKWFGVFGMIFLLLALVILHLFRRRGERRDST